MLNIHIDFIENIMLLLYKYTNIIQQYLSIIIKIIIIININKIIIF